MKKILLMVLIISSLFVACKKTEKIVIVSSSDTIEVNDSTMIDSVVIDSTKK